MIFALAMQAPGLHYLAAQVVATAFVLVWNFAANRLWTFEEKVSGAKF
jgi:putative flippase GtrA